MSALPPKADILRWSLFSHPQSIGGIQIACHGIEEGRFDATIEMTAQTVSG